MILKKEKNRFIILGKVYPVRKKIFNGIRNRNFLTGFTLLELMIALSVLTVSALAAIHTFVIVASNRAFAYHMSVSSNLCQDKLEELKNLSYGDLIVGSYSDANNPIDESGETDGIYSRSWNVLDDTPIPGTKSVSVTVNWPPVETATHAVTLSTVKGE